MSFIAVLWLPIVAAAVIVFVASSIIHMGPFWHRGECPALPDQDRVQDLVEVAFSHVGLDWHDYVRKDPRFLRPAEVDHLIGDAGKARRVLGWEPSVDFGALVRMMVEADLERLTRR